MLPTPVSEYIPEILKQNPSAAGTALCDVLDECIADCLDDVKKLGNSFDPVRCDASALDDLAIMFGFDPNVITILTFFLVDEAGDMLQDDLGNDMVETVEYSVPQGENPAKRIGIAKAVQSYKNWDLFVDHIKPLIESMTGFTCSIYKGEFLTDESGNTFVDDIGWFLTDLPTGDSYLFIDIGGSGALPPDVVIQVSNTMKRDCDVAYIQIKIGYVVAEEFYTYDVI